VVDLSTETPKLLRPGLISRAEIEAVIGPVEVVHLVSTGESTLAAPGMLARHYAPRTALETAETETDWQALIQLYETAGLRVARWQPQGTPGQVAAQLYAQLHTLDAGQFDRIIALLPPDQGEWYAVRDRLVRAAASD
jgi:L-threonylcarbamoyladenylate synthase